MNWIEQNIDTLTKEKSPLTEWEIDLFTSMCIYEKTSATSDTLEKQELTKMLRYKVNHFYDAKLKVSAAVIYFLVSTRVRTPIDITILTALLGDIAMKTNCFTIDTKCFTSVYSKTLWSYDNHMRFWELQKVNGQNLLDMSETYTEIITHLTKLRS